MRSPSATTSTWGPSGHQGRGAGASLSGTMESAGCRGRTGASGVVSGCIPHRNPLILNGLYSRQRPERAAGRQIWVSRSGSCNLRCLRGVQRAFLVAFRKPRGLAAKSCQAKNARGEALFECGRAAELDAETGRPSVSSRRSAAKSPTTSTPSPSRRHRRLTPLSGGRLGRPVRLSGRGNTEHSPRLPCATRPSWNATARRRYHAPPGRPRRRRPRIWNLAARPPPTSGVATTPVDSQRRAPAARTALRAAAFAAVRPPLAPPKLKMR